MLEIYDRVIPGRSIPTLIGISLLAFILFGLQGLLDIVRSRVLVRIAASIDQKVSPRVYDVAAKLPLRAMTPRGYQPLHDLDRIRSFMSTVGPAALFDLPWMPLYLGICFLFHPLIGITATVGGLILVAITLLTEFLSRGPTREASGLADSRMALADASRRNAEVVQAMGMGGRLAVLWEGYNRRHLGAQLRVADIAGGLGALSRMLRMALQSAVLGIGAYLVINQQASAGIIIASSILTSRALAPVEVAIAHWRGFVAARQSWRRLNGLLTMMPAEPPRMELPRPMGSLTVEAVSVVPRHQSAGRAGRGVPAESWPGIGGDRTERLRKIFAGQGHRRRMADRTGQNPHRRRRHRPMVGRGVGIAHRLSAAGHGAVRRHDCAEHRPLRRRSAG